MFCPVRELSLWYVVTLTWAHSGKQQAEISKVAQNIRQVNCIAKRLHEPRFAVATDVDVDAVANEEITELQIDLDIIIIPPLKLKAN